MQHGAIGIGADDDVAELLGGHQASLGAHRVGELLPGGDRLAADLAGGIDIVLGLERADDSVAVTPSLAS